MRRQPFRHPQEELIGQARCVDRAISSGFFQCALDNLVGVMCCHLAPKPLQEDLFHSLGVGRQPARAQDSHTGKIPDFLPQGEGELDDKALR